MKFNVQKIVYVGLTVLSLGAVGSVSANAAKVNNNSKPSSYVSKHINIPLSKKMAKKGYIFTFNNSKMNDGLRNNFNSKKSNMSVKTIHKLIKNKTKFKIYKVWKYRNGVQFKTVSRNGKYRGWTDVSNLNDSTSPSKVGLLG